MMAEIAIKLNKEHFLLFKEAKKVKFIKNSHLIYL